MGNRNKKRQIYEPAMIKALEGIPLPKKIKCDRCGLQQGKDMFSHRQLTDARKAIKERKTYKIRCRPCCGEVIIELECTICNVVKGVEAFAKVQRAKPDTAKCYDCMEKQLETDPVNEEVYEQPDKAFVPVEKDFYPDFWGAPNSTHGTTNTEIDDEWGSEHGGVSLEDAFRRLGEDVSGTGTLIDTEDIYSNSDRWGPVNSANDGWQVAGAKSNSKTTTSNLYSVTGSSSGFGSNITQRSQGVQYNKNGWAKIKAYKPEKTLAPDDDWKSESEEEEDEDDALHSDDNDEDDDFEI